MPTSNTVATGAPYNDGGGTDAGQVRVFDWNGSAWVQRGTDIDGENALDRSGSAISMPDINTIAIGALKNGGNGVDAGHVRIYIWNGSAWVQKGGDIDGEAAGDRSGTSVSMPDANTVAIGATLNDGNGADAGHARVYTWNGSAWIQKGQDLDGLTAGDNAGGSVSMPDANTIAISSVMADGVNTTSGHVRVFTWNGSAWVTGLSPIEGEGSGDRSGTQISMPDATCVGIGARFNSGGGTWSGHVRMFNVGSLLPVTWSSFYTALQADGTVALDWQTSSEKNNDFFTLERSSDGEQFEAIGRVPSVKNSSESTNYTYVDTEPKYGVNLYRVRQTDLDGQTSLSGMQTIYVTNSRQMDTSASKSSATKACIHDIESTSTEGY